MSTTETKDDSLFPEYIEVSGRIGYNNQMNGIYQKCSKLWHEYPQWKQIKFDGKEMTELFCIRRNHDTNIWIFDWITPNYDKYCSYAQWEDNNANSSSPLQCNNQWKVWNTNTNTYIIDPAVIIKLISPNKYTTLKQAYDSVPDMFVVSGRVGFNNEMNGIYMRCDSDYNGRPQWNFKTEEFWLRWQAKQGRWVFDWQKPDNPYAILKEDKLLPTMLEGNWIVWNPKESQFNDIDSNIILTPYESEVEYYDRLGDITNVASYILVKGRIGYNHQMNGIYIRVDTNWEGRPMYVQSGKTGNERFTIRWWPEKAMWIFDWQTVYKWYVENNDNVGHPSLCEKHKWRVWNKSNSTFEIDENIELIPLTKDEYDRKQKELRQLIPAPSYMYVSGRKGYNNQMNGLYCRIQKDMNGKPQYVQPENDFIIRWHSGEKAWIFDWKQLYSWYVQATDDVSDPSLVDRTKWAVWKKSDSLFNDFDENICVEALDENEINKRYPCSYIEVYGRRGFNAININGLYKNTNIIENDKPCWIKTGNKQQIEQNKECKIKWNKIKKQWQLCFDGDCWMRLKKDTSLPINDDDENESKHDDNEWEIYMRHEEQKEGSWKIDKNVNVIKLSMIDVFGHGMLCPKGDNLLSYHAPNEEIACSLCGIPLEVIDIMYNCYRCDVIYCSNCGDALDVKFAEIRSRNSHFSKIFSISWSPSDKDDMFATCSHDGHVKLWGNMDRAPYLTAKSIQGNCEFLKDIEISSPKSVKFSQSGSFLAVRNDDNILIYDVQASLCTESPSPIRRIKIENDSLLIDKTMVWIDDKYAVIATQNNGIKLVNMLDGKIIGRMLKDEIKGALQIEIADVSSRHTLIAILSLPTSQRVYFMLMDRKSPSKINVKMVGCVSIGNINDDTTFGQTTAEGYSDSILKSIGFGGRFNFWFFGGDNRGHIHFWKINILNEKDIDITDPMHPRPTLEFIVNEINDKDQRHFLSILSVAGCTGSDIIVSGSKDGNLVLWSLHSGKPAASLFVEQAGGIEGRCNEIWTVDIRPGQAIFGTWNRTVGVYSVVDKALVLLREEDKHSNIGEGERKTKTTEIEDEDEEKLNENEIELSMKDIELECIKQWSVLGAWYNIWVNGDALLYGIQSMVKGVIDNLKSDKIDYIKLQREVQKRDEIDFHKVCELVKDIKDNYIDNKYKNGNIIKQDTNNLINIMERGHKVQKGLISLARSLSTQERVWGIFEGDPGVKKLQRSVEKCVLDKFEKSLKIIKNDDNDNIFKDKSVDYGELKDLSRAGILLRNMNAIYHALDKLRESEYFLGKRVKIVRIKNRFGWKHSGLGYRDILINLILPDIDPTFIAELQLHHRSFHQIRSRGSGHANYKAARFLLDFVVLMTDKDNKKIKFQNKSTARDDIQKLIHQLIDMS